MEGLEHYHIPLHETTQLYGEEGLEARFRYEVSLLDFSAEDQSRIDSALELALYAHSPQTRGEHPYSTHVLRVGTRIIHHFQITDPDIIIAALLHDVVEDQPERVIGESGLNLAEKSVLQPAALSRISEQYGKGAASLIAAVTNDEPNPNSRQDKNELYRENITRKMKANPKARIIKLSDFIDNCSGIIYNESPEKAKKLAGKYLPLIPVMKDFAIMPDTPLGSPTREYIIERLSRAEDRCQELLAT